MFSLHIVGAHVVARSWRGSRETIALKAINMDLEPLQDLNIQFVGKYDRGNTKGRTQKWSGCNV
jgi:hypothetical protein